jgi:hypothetical protein
MGTLEMNTEIGRPERRLVDDVKLGLGQIGCGKWMELDQYLVQWWALVLAVSELRIPLPRNWIKW